MRTRALLFSTLLAAATLPGVVSADEVPRELLLRFNELVQSAERVEASDGTEAAIVVYRDALVDLSYGRIHLRLARLHQNLLSQDTVIQAGRSYTRHLEGQLAKLAKAEAQLKQHQEISLNTYETVSLASSMLNVVKKSLEDLKTIQSMELPDMLPLETDRIRSEFQVISKQLRGD